MNWIARDLQKRGQDRRSELLPPDPRAAARRKAGRSSTTTVFGGWRGPGLIPADAYHVLSNTARADFGILSKVGGEGAFSTWGAFTS